MIAFGTVVYPAALQYFAEFIDSLNCQTYYDFELIIVNDNIDEVELRAYLKRYKGRYDIVSYHEQMSPGDLRVELLRESKSRGYELIILGDADDIFDTDRVRNVLEVYSSASSYWFYYNSLMLFDKTNALKEMPKITDDIRQIMECNYLGLSNTSVNLRKLSFEFIDSLKGCTSSVFDWYLYSRILDYGGSGVFVPDAITYYRIHSGNIAGVPSIEQLDTELKVKKAHYSLMKMYNAEYEVLLEQLNSYSFDKFTPLADLSYWWDNIKVGS